MTNEDIYCNFCKEVENKQNSIQKAYHFNVLDAQCGHIVENSHTNILMQILQYKNQYGYVFLEDFISLAGFDIHIEKNDDIQFNTEYFNKGNENDKERQGRIDGLVCCKNKFAIIIENKINGAGNQPKQLCRYVDAIINDEIVSGMEQVWIVFLTREGVEDPDPDSVKYLRDNDLLDKNNADDKNITGSNYFPCTYRDNILDWLKENVLPIVMHKEESLYSGLVQYIDFLEGLLGKRDSALVIELKQWFKEQEFWKEKGREGIIKQNKFLQDLYNDVNIKRSELTKNKEYDDNKIKIIDLFRTIIDEILEEPMMNFLDVTKNYFVQNKLISLDSYHLNHHPGYYYITIRDKKWPKGVYFGWVLLGINMLVVGSKKRITLCVLI